MQTPDQLDVFDGFADGAENDWVVTHQLVNCVDGQLRALGEQRPLVGVVGQHLHRRGELVAGGVGAGAEQRRAQHEQFVVGEPVTIVFGSDELRDQVVGQRRTALGDQLLEVGIELIPCGQDHRTVFGDVPIEDLLDVIGPVAEQVLILRRCAQQRADDRRGVAASDVDDDVAASRLGERADQAVDDLDDERAQPLRAPGGEGLGYQATQPVMRGAVKPEDIADGPVPQRAGGNALQAEPEVARGDESTVATRSGPARNSTPPARAGRPRSVRARGLRR